MSLRYNYNILFPMIASKIELTLFDNRKIIANVNFKLDTGADLTCIPSKLLGIFQRESEFSYSIQKSNNLSYIVNGHKAKNPLIVAKTRGVDTFAQPMKHYCFQVDNLSLLDSFGNIGLKLGSVPTTAYASFATDSSQTNGGSKTYKFYFLEREVFKNVYCNQ